MNTIKSASILVLLAPALLVATAFAAPQSDLERAMSHDGLQKISVKGIDLAYARPGATLAAYNRVKLEPVEVSFSKDWKPTASSGSRIKPSNEVRENIRTGVAKLVYEEFVKELQNKGSYKVVDEIGPDVLRVKTYIANLYVSAPDTGSAAIQRTYTVSAGEMTLVSELYDSETGQILARVVDRHEARRAGTLMLTNSATNFGEAQSAASAWARTLRSGLDRAHGIGKK